MDVDCEIIRFSEYINHACEDGHVYCDDDHVYIVANYRRGGDRCVRFGKKHPDKFFILPQPISSKQKNLPYREDRPSRILYKNWPSVNELTKRLMRMFNKGKISYLDYQKFLFWIVAVCEPRVKGNGSISRLASAYLEGMQCIWGGIGRDQNGRVTIDSKQIWRAYFVLIDVLDYYRAAFRLYSLSGTNTPTATPLEKEECKNDEVFRRALQNFVEDCRKVDSRNKGGLDSITTENDVVLDVRGLGPDANEVFLTQKIVELMMTCEWIICEKFKTKIEQDLFRVASKGYGYINTSDPLKVTKHSYKDLTDAANKLVQHFKDELDINNPTTNVAKKIYSLVPKSLKLSFEDFLTELEQFKKNRIIHR